MTDGAPAASGRGPGGFVIITLLALFVLAALIALGTWQIQRMHWKHALVAAVAERMRAPPVPPPGPGVWDRLVPDDYRYTHVALDGRFLPGEARVYALLSDARGPLSGAGYWIVAPFETDAGFVVLVNRGFVPMDGRTNGPAVPEHAPPPEGPVTLEGYLREPDPPSWLTPDPDPAAGLFFVRDAATLAPAMTLPALPVAPYTVDAAASATPPGGLPQAGETRTVFPDSHLQYALTWYGLALGLVGVYAAWAWRRFRPRPGDGVTGR